MIKRKSLFSLLTAIILLSATTTTTFAQNEPSDRARNYIQQYKDLAMAEMIRTGVPASITLAQGILETAGGQSDLASNANNHFGIKCKNNWTGETIYHDDDAKGECFRKYPSVEESYKDHSDFLKSRPNYAFLFKLDPTDYEGWAKGLRRAGYATNPNYAQMLIKTIIENNLQQYSVAVLDRIQKHDDVQNNVASNTIDENDKEVIEDLQEIDPAQVPQVLAAVQQQTPKAEMKKKPAAYPLNSIFTINDTRVIYAEAGTSLLALANQYNTALKKLMEFNDLEETEILAANQLIYLEKKGKKGAKEIHIVQENETLHEIAQTEGIQLSAILEYNGLKKGMQPAIGERIYLKASAPVSPKLAAAAVGKNAVSM